MGRVDSGLGWSCDENYYVHNADVLLGSAYWGSGRWRQYYKKFTGPAVSVYVKNANGYHGSYLLSTVSDYSVVYHTGAYAATGIPEICEIASVTWYFCGVNNIRARDYGWTYDTSFPVIEVDNSSLENDIITILEAAGVLTKGGGTNPRLLEGPARQFRDISLQVPVNHTPGREVA